MALEKVFENKVKAYLESIGCYDFGTPKHKITKPIIGYWTKRWGGGKFTKSGLPDMQVVINGRCVELEIKAPKGKPTELQLKNIDMINRSGGKGFILVESEETADKLTTWRFNNYPQYSRAYVMDFKNFKCFCQKLLTL